MAIDKVVDSNVLDGYFSDIADAIRSKDGTVNRYTPAEMPVAIARIPSGGEDTLKLASRGELSGEVVIDYTGGNNTYLPGVIVKMAPGFNDGITRLTIEATEGQFDSLSAVNPLSNSNGYSLQEIDLTNLEATRFGIGNASNGAWQNLTKVTANRLKALLNAWQYFLRYATALRSVKFPSLVQLMGSDFSGCTALEIADLGNSALTAGSYTAQIANNSFGSCSSLTAMVLRSQFMYALQNVSAFTGTPIASGTGYIYVPRNLIATYEAATNWSTYAGQFRAIEDYTDDGTIDGEFIPPAA